MLAAVPSFRPSVGAWAEAAQAVRGRWPGGAASLVNAEGLDVLFIADGIHGEDVEPYTSEHVTELLASGGTHAAHALRALRWAP